MSGQSRRRFLQRSSLALGITGAGSLLLAADTAPTPASGELGDYERYLSDVDVAAKPKRTTAPRPTGKWAATEDNILGPFHRAGAPYRAKITPPLASGKVLVVQGRVWGLDTRRPLAGAVLDVWQANAAGRYDNDDPRNPPQAGTFLYRARLLTDENGYYEYETIHPGAYRIGRDRWRPSHIHYLVRAAGYRKLITQLYFVGDPRNETDDFIKPSLIVDFQQLKTDAGSYEHGTFDIVLVPA
ncbi:MAG: hypothetical protein OES79_02945 [Planctomycetota bacterium]|nr:hypothetical protein [Planctomycetota bacterium]